MSFIYPVWLFITAFFLYFAYINWRQSGEDIRPFTFRQRGEDPDEDPEAVVSAANVRFTHDFNAYLETVNILNKKRHRAAAVGYFIASLLSLGSLFMWLFIG
jgi:hypothetical protein